MQAEFTIIKGTVKTGKQQNVNKMQNPNVVLFSPRGHKETGFPTSHDSPDWADEIEDLGFDTWIIPKTSNSLLDTPADWRRGRKEIKREVETEKGRETAGGDSNL